MTEGATERATAEAAEMAAEATEMAAEAAMVMAVEMVEAVEGTHRRSSGRRRLLLEGYKLATHPAAALRPFDCV